MLEIKNLKKSFKNKVVLKDISINVKKGEIVGLLGQMVQVKQQPLK